MAVPDFFIAGVPKAGTTALHAALKRHPQLYLPSVKEPKFFLGDGEHPPRHTGPGDAHSDREWVWRREDYERLFEPAPPGSVRGEASAFYLADPAALRRIRAAAPEAKFVIVLRDPVDRAYSNWAHLWADGLEPSGDFLAACADEERRRADGWGPIWRYRATGRYGEQLEHLLGLYPRERVHLVRYMALVDHPSRTLDDICRFLGVEAGPLEEVPSRNVGAYVAPSRTTSLLQAAFRAGAAAGSHFPPQVWRKLSLPLQWAMQRSPRHRPELEPGQRAALLDDYVDDIVMVERLTGWDLSTWRSYRVGGTYSVRKSWEPSRRLVS